MLDDFDHSGFADTEQALADLTEELSVLTSWLRDGVGDPHAHRHSEFFPTEAVQYTRKNLHDMTADEGRRLRAAFSALNTPSNRVWGRYVFLHVLFGGIAHGGIRFLPWHRLMIWSIEQELRSTPDGRGLSIPYWTWWQPEGNVRKVIPSEWGRFAPTILMPDAREVSDRGFQSLLRRLFDRDVLRSMEAVMQPNGLSGTSGMQRLVSNALRRSSVPVLRPSLSRLASGRPMPIQPGGRQLIELPSQRDVRGALSIADFRAFTDRLERIHGRPHLWVGLGASGGQGALGDIEYSPSDCLFYFHHCEVDRLYHLWQQRHPRSRFSGRLTGAELPPWTETVAQVSDISGAALGFDYANNAADTP